MVGYSVLEMYLRTIGIFLLTFKRYVEKTTLGSPHFSEGGGGHKKCAPGLKNKNSMWDCCQKRERGFT